MRGVSESEERREKRTSRAKKIVTTSENVQESISSTALAGRGRETGTCNRWQHSLGKKTGIKCLLEKEKNEDSRRIEFQSWPLRSQYERAKIVEMSSISGSRKGKKKKRGRKRGVSRSDL